jgi:hypothetical protein
VSLLLILGIIAVAQMVFVVLLAAFVLLRRERLMRRSERVKRGRAVLGKPLVRWLVGASSVEHLADELKVLPNPSALAFAAEIHDTRVPPDQWPGFGAALRNVPAMQWAIAGADSWRWWRRLDAARAFGIVGTRDDADTLDDLLDDPHPAVRLAATQALSSVDDPRLVRIAVAHYPREALAVRLFTTNTLRLVWQQAEAPLHEFLATPNAMARDLAAWLGLAESLNVPSLRTAITALSTHADPEVRVAVARALRRYPHRESVEALRVLLDDPQDFVRAGAAQALGALRAGEALPQLERRLTDLSWWVRFRCALALALLGEPGRAALRRARQSPDRLAADMAVLTSGLSDGAVLELADV